MSFFEQNKESLQKGFLGETKVRDFLKSHGVKFMQIDIMYEKEGSLYIGEVKTQERFKAPPFDGHGLPPYQLEQRIRVASMIGARAVLFVYDLEDNRIYWQFMDVLVSAPDDKKFTTKTGSRIIFSLDLFDLI